KVLGHLTLFNDNMQYKGISSAINTAALKMGYQVFTLTSHEELKEEEKQINELIGRRVDGVIITSNCSIPEHLINRLINKQIPVVMIERTNEIPQVDRIVVNDYLGSMNAVRHMIQKGHRKIAFIGAELNGQVEIDRFNGYLDALHEAGIPKNEEWIKIVPKYSLEFGRIATIEFLNNELAPSAIFMTSDLYASGVLQVLYDRDLRVPKDMSLIGYDNTLSAFLSPPITSVGLPFHEIGEHAVSLLMKRIKNSSTEASTIEIDPFLMDRFTVRNWRE
ncbi:substrate-binding domain-containing protein, partial [Terribacillus saccharophilus]|uniref:substrate-binding domain-containing protein n=1 Tax=Terribacillus saccharophilus TaxID=361277 RepID=UPI002DC1AC0E|nr:substrate-binding domain-containing protein [Terribacillus saccharophilus]